MKSLLFRPVLASSFCWRRSVWEYVRPPITTPMGFGHSSQVYAVNIFGRHVRLLSWLITVSSTLLLNMTSLAPSLGHCTSTLHYYIVLRFPMNSWSNTCRSPLITTMPYFSHIELPSKDAPLPSFPPPAPKSIKDDTKLLCKRINEKLQAGKCANNGTIKRRSGFILNGNGNDEIQLEKSSKRRNYFANANNRHQITFGPKVRN